MTAAVETTDGVDDLDAVAVRPPLAPWWRRAVAALLDATVVGAATFVAVGPGGWPWEWSVVLGGSSGSTALPHAGVLVAVVAGVVVLLALQAWTGATPGKRVVGVVVVRESDGRPAGPVRTAARTAAHALDLVLLVGFLRPVWDERRRTFADSLCATDVRVARQVPGRRDAHGRRRGAAPRGRRRRGVATTAVAALVCGGSVALAAVSSTSSTPEVAQACGLDDRPMGEDPPIATVEVRVPATVRQTRLGLSRHVSPPAVATVTWVVADQEVAADGTRLSVWLLTAAGDEVAELGGTVEGGTLVPDEGAVLGGLTLPVPWSALRAAGPDGTWDAGVGTPSVRAALCGGPLAPS